MQNASSTEPWQKNNILLEEDYKKQNIKIIEYKNRKQSCLILCSSHAIYYPNTEAEYIKKIRRQDRYEWENITKNNRIRNNFSKIIFIRDIYKQWYVSGVSITLNSIDALVDYLRKEIGGMGNIVTAGNSAGAYAAVLIGVLLNADRIINISGQYSLLPYIDKNFLLQRYQNNINYSKYYNLYTFLQNNKEPILYFFPAKCPDDNYQFALVKHCPNIMSFRINSAQHGTGINAVWYPYLFTGRSKEIDKIYRRYKDKMIEENMFYYDFNSLIIEILRFPVRLITKIVRHVKQIILF